jgi:hypothetical protein
VLAKALRKSIGIPINLVRTTLNYVWITIRLTRCIGASIQAGTLRHPFHHPGVRLQLALLQHELSMYQRFSNYVVRQWISARRANRSFCAGVEQNNAGQTCEYY